MAYLGVPILQDVSITFYHYSGIVRGSRFVLVCFSFVFRKVRGQARKRWRVGERKKAFQLTTVSLFLKCFTRPYFFN